MGCRSNENWKKFNLIYNRDQYNSKKMTIWWIKNSLNGDVDDGDWNDDKFFDYRSKKSVLKLNFTHTHTQTNKSYISDSSKSNQTKQKKIIENRNFFKSNENDNDE